MTKFETELERKQAIWYRIMHYYHRMCKAADGAEDGMDSDDDERDALAYTAWQSAVAAYAAAMDIATIAGFESVVAAESPEGMEDLLNRLKRKEP